MKDALDASEQSIQVLPKCIMRRWYDKTTMKNVVEGYGAIQSEVRYLRSSFKVISSNEIKENWCKLPNVCRQATICQYHISVQLQVCRIWSIHAANSFKCAAFDPWKHIEQSIYIGLFWRRVWFSSSQIKKRDRCGCKLTPQYHFPYIFRNKSHKDFFHKCIFITDYK